MTTNHRRGRRSASIATALVTVTLTAGLLTGCDSVDGSANCFRNAGTIADSLRAIHEAGLDAANDPAQTDRSIDTINKNLDKIDDKSDDGKVDKAVNKLSKALKDYNKAVLNGDSNPDASKIRDAADELADVCTP